MSCDKVTSGSNVPQQECPDVSAASPSPEHQQPQQPKNRISVQTVFAATGDLGTGTAVLEGTDLPISAHVTEGTVAQIGYQRRFGPVYFGGEVIYRMSRIFSSNNGMSEKPSNRFDKNDYGINGSMDLILGQSPWLGLEIGANFGASLTHATGGRFCFSNEENQVMCDRLRAGDGHSFNGDIHLTVLPLQGYLTPHNIQVALYAFVRGGMGTAHVDMESIGEQHQLTWRGESVGGGAAIVIPWN